MRVTVSIPDPIGREAEELARERGTSVSALYANAVEELLRQHRRREAIEALRKVIGVGVDAVAYQELVDDRRASDRELP